MNMPIKFRKGQLYLYTYLKRKFYLFGHVLGEIANLPLRHLNADEIKSLLQVRQVNKAIVF